MKALLKIVGFLKKYPDRPLTYKKSEKPKTGKVSLGGISDSSYADEIPSRRSSYGYFVHVNGSPVAWKARVTPSVATSVAEAEYVALSECLKEILHIQGLLEDIGYTVEKPIILKTDSQAAKGIADYQQISGRSKHITIRYHFLREKVDAKEVEVKHIPTATNIADMFTKNLGPNKFWHLLNMTQAGM